MTEHSLGCDGKRLQHGPDCWSKKSHPCGCSDWKMVCAEGFGNTYDERCAAHGGDWLAKEGR